MIIPETDGKKMSKSYGNTIDVFEMKKDLKNKLWVLKLTVNL